MNVLLDECLPWKLKFDLVGHKARTVTETGWSGIKNGRLLQRAIGSFDVFLTADRGIEHQQNLTNIPIAIIILKAANTKLETLRPLMPQVLEALSTIQPGEIRRITQPEQGQAT